jgi:hypothetical protein
VEAPSGLVRSSRRVMGNRTLAFAVTGSSRFVEVPPKRSGRTHVPRVTK